VNATDPNPGDVLTYSLTTFPAGMTINATTGVIAWTPTAAQVYSQAVTVRVADQGGLFVTQTFTISVRRTLFAPNSVPAVITTQAGSGEAGMKFQSSVAGFITGVRFYKSASNTGTHVGSLWSSTGALLGSVTFTGETASGWQQANFATPIAISANTTYVISYHLNVGYVSLNDAYFTAAVTNGPLTGLQNGGANGPNGVYSTSATPAFPNLGLNSSNLWVDVVFTTTP
jgi:hypothetical protein